MFEKIQYLCRIAVLSGAALPLKRKPMKKLLLPTIGCLLLLEACAPNWGPRKDQATLQKLDSLAARLAEASDANRDQELAETFVAEATRFYERHPEDSLAVEHFFRAGEVYRGLKEYGKAIELFGRLWRENPRHPKAPVALFLQAFTFDTSLQDSTLARHYYRNFLEKYPDHPLGAQVRQLLEVAGTDPAELVRRAREQPEQ